MKLKTIFAIALIALFYTNLYSQCTITGPTNVCKTIEYTYSVNLGPDQTVRWRLVNRLGKFMSTNLDQCIIQWEKTGTETLLAEIRVSNGTIVSQCSLSINISHFDDFEIKPIPSSGGNAENKIFNACKNMNLKFITTLYSNYSYSWTYNSSPVGNNSNTVEFNSGNILTGELCLTVVNLINSCSKTICLQINLFDPPSVDFQWYGGNDPDLLNICLGDEILFTNNSIHENGNSYLWELIFAGSVLQSTNSSNLNNPFLTTFSTPGTYIVRLTGYNATKCKTIKEETINVNQNVKLKINSIRNTVCEGEELVYSVADICSDYSWTVENGLFNPVPGNNPTATVVWQNPGPSGIGTIFITPSNCQSSICNATSKEHVFVIPSNLDDYISGPQTICDIESNTVALYSAPKWPGVDYNWEISGPGTQNFITTKRANEFLVNINAGFNGPFMVHLSLSSSIINCNNSGSLSVDVYNNKILDLTPQHCYNTDAQFEIENYNSNMIVNWTLVFNGIELLTSSDYPLTISKTLMNKAGIYNLFAEVHMNGMNCNQKLDFTVKNPIQSPIEVAGQQYICPGTEHMYSIAETSPGEVEWDIIGGTITGQPMKNHIIILWFSNQSSYQVSARWKENDCYSEWTRLDVFNKENLNASIIGPDIVCNGSTTVYSINYPNSEFYTWRIDPPTLGQIISGQRTQSITVEWNNVSQVSDAKVILDILDCNLSKYYDLLITVNNGSIPQLLGDPCVGQSSILLVNALGASAYYWDFGDGTMDTTTTNTVSHIYQTEGSYFVKVSWNEPNNCYMQNYINGWLTALNPEKIDIYAYKCPVNQNNNSIEDCEPLGCLDPNKSYILRFLATQFVGVTEYRWEVVKNNVFAEYYTTSSPILELEQPINGKYIGAKVIVRTDHNELNRNCIIASDSTDIPLCISPQGECEHDTVNLKIDPFTQIDCKTYFYEGQIDPFADSIVKSRWWAVNDGFTNPKYEIDNPQKLQNRTSEFQKAGAFSISLNATVYQLGSIVDTCITPVSISKPVILNILPRIVYQFDCSDTDYSLKVNAFGSLYSPPPIPSGAIFSWYKNNTSNLLGSSEELVIPPAELPNAFVLILIAQYNGQSCTTQVTVVKPALFEVDFKQNIKACEGSIVDFGLIGAGVDQIVSWYWQFGDGSFSFSPHPNKVYSTPGNYTVNLTIKNQYGCELILSKEINVIPNNLTALIEYSLDDCMISNTINCVPSDGTEPYSYLWSTGQTGNPIVSEQNRFFVTVTDDNGCMTIAGPIELMTDQIFLSNLNGPTTICQRTQNKYTFFRNTNPIYGYRAYYRYGSFISGNIPINGNQIQFSIQNYSGPITLKVEGFKLSNPNEICDVIELQIIVNPLPQISLAVDTISCDPRLIKIRETSGREVVWYYEQSEIATGSFIITNTPGTYFAHYTTPEGCIAQVQRNIPSSPSLHINLEGDYTICDSLLFDNDTNSPKLFGFVDITGSLIPISQFKLYGDETLASFEQNIGNQLTALNPSVVLNSSMKNKYIRLWTKDNFQCEYISEPFHFLTKTCSCQDIISSQIDIKHDKTQSGYDYYNVMGLFQLPDEFEFCPSNGLLFGKLEIVGTIQIRKLTNGKTELRAYVRQVIGTCDGVDTATVSICFENLRCETPIPVIYECCPEDPQECMVQTVGCILCHYPQYGYFTTDIRIIPSSIFGQNPGCTNLNIKVLYPGTQIVFDQNYSWVPGSTEPNITLSLPMPATGNMLCGVVIMRVTGANCDISCNVPFCIDLSGCGLFNSGTQFLSFSNSCNGTWSENQNLWSFNMIQTGNEQQLVFLNPLIMNNGQVLNVVFPHGNDQIGGFITSQDTSIGNFTVSYHDFSSSQDYCYNENWPLDTCGGMLFRSFLNAEINQEDQLAIIPNPVQDNFRILYKLINPENKYVIKMIGTNGKELIRFENCARQGEYFINSSNFVSGVYSVLLLSENEVIKAKKLIIIK